MWILLTSDLPHLPGLYTINQHVCLFVKKVQQCLHLLRVLKWNKFRMNLLHSEVCRLHCGRQYDHFHSNHYIYSLTFRETLQMHQNQNRQTTASSYGLSGHLPLGSHWTRKRCKARALLFASMLTNVEVPVGHPLQLAPWSTRFGICSILCASRERSLSTVQKASQRKTRTFG